MCRIGMSLERDAIATLSLVRCLVETDVVQVVSH